MHAHRYQQALRSSVVARQASYPATRSAPPRAHLVAVGLTAAVLLCDLLQFSVSMPFLVLGALDEFGHAVTALLVLLLIPHLPWGSFARWALLGSVLLDLDHLPAIVHTGMGAQAETRPFTHSLLTVLVTVLVAWVVPKRYRSALFGLAAGFALHLVRDFATGYGVVLFWPLSTYVVLVPYAWYLAALLAMCGWIVHQHHQRAVAQRRLPR